MKILKKQETDNHKKIPKSSE